MAAVDRDCQGSYVEQQFNIDKPIMHDVLTLKQLADHLQLSERTIYRLLGRGQLPGFKVGGHWRFRRSVVDYWLDMRMGRMSAGELREMDGDWRASALCVSDALTEENALLPVSGTSRREVVHAFISAVTFAEPVDAELIEARVWEREQLSSTGTGGGVAVLHTARWHGRAMHTHDLLAVGRVRPPMDFGAADGGLTDVLLLLLARDAGQHLILLAKAARLCHVPGFLTAIRCAASARAVVTLVRDTERQLFADFVPPLS